MAACKRDTEGKQTMRRQTFTPQPLRNRLAVPIQEYATSSAAAYVGGRRRFYPGQQVAMRSPAGHLASTFWPDRRVGVTSTVPAVSSEHYASSRSRTWQLSATIDIPRQHAGSSGKQSSAEAMQLFPSYQVMPYRHGGDFVCMHFVTVIPFCW